jgi:hypothetical protein
MPVYGTAMRMMATSFLKLASSTYSSSIDSSTDSVVAIMQVINPLSHMAAAVS